MVECTRCGCRNDDNSRFCAACGFSMLPQLGQRPAQPLGGTGPAPWPTPAQPGAFPLPAPTAAPVPSDPMWPAAVPVPPPHPVADGWNSPAAPTPGYTGAPPSAAAAESSPRVLTPAVGQTLPSVSAAPVLVGFLVSFEGDALGRFWPLYQGLRMVGRSGTSDGLDVAIEHNTTSARHAQLTAQSRPNRLVVQDVGSTNGTFINDQRLALGKPQVASHGDRIRFGGYTVEVVLIA